MTEPKPSLDEVYQRWRKEHPIQTVSERFVPDGYRPCRTLGCPVYIEVEQDRVYCYGCGGSPSPREPYNPYAWVEHVAELRLGDRLEHVRGRPYTP